MCAMCKSSSRKFYKSRHFITIPSTFLHVKHRYLWVIHNSSFQAGVCVCQLFSAHFLDNYVTEQPLQKFIPLKALSVPIWIGHYLRKNEPPTFPFHNTKMQTWIICFWGRCYDHNFQRFFANLWRKNGRFFSKTIVMIKILHNLALFWFKNANFFRWFFRQKTSVPG
jgi:hypothetical protein